MPTNDVGTTVADACAEAVRAGITRGAESRAGAESPARFKFQSAGDEWARRTDIRFEAPKSTAAWPCYEIERLSMRRQVSSTAQTATRQRKTIDSAPNHSQYIRYEYTVFKSNTIRVYASLEGDRGAANLALVSPKDRFELHCMTASVLGVTDRFLLMLSGPPWSPLWSTPKRNSQGD
jgi:hypothetical protein